MVYVRLVGRSYEEQLMNTYESLGEENIISQFKGLWKLLELMVLPKCLVFDPGKSERTVPCS
jgi:hypothetical protein